MKMATFQITVLGLTSRQTIITGFHGKSMYFHIGRRVSCKQLITWNYLKDLGLVTSWGTTSQCPMVSSRVPLPYHHSSLWMQGAQRAPYPA